MTDSIPVAGEWTHAAETFVEHAGECVQSVRASVRPLSSRSGAMYAIVPIVAPVPVSPVSVVARAIPKSMRYTKFLAVTSMFAGFTSRALRPLACAASSAAAACSMIDTARSGAAARRESKKPTSMPSMSGIVRNKCPLCSPKS